MARWLGIDHGTKRTGVAVGNCDDCIATPLSVIPAEPLEDAIQAILKLADRYDAVGIAVGLPVNMDGSEGPQAKLARRMAAELANKTELDVRLWDERLSSFEADQALAGKLTRKKKKLRQDAVAAATMLGDFLRSGGPENAAKP
ncbi:MAG: Holliday junction resolvase RuvX [Planctomycetota bacterium]|jgi:putative Holliday junction resolvase